MATDAAFTALGDERFVSLTTFRKSGTPVATTVWIARDGDDLVVTTPAGSGKVKRLRNKPRVEIRPSSRTGKVADGAVPIAGGVDLVADQAQVGRLTELFRRKYGLEYRIFMLIERLFASGQRERIILRIRQA